MRVVIVLLGLLFTFLAMGCQHQEGTVQYSDCREKIYIKSDSWRLHTDSYICDYNKVGNGRITGGKCVHVEVDDGICETAYIYNVEVKPDSGCSKKYPYLGKDNKCYTNWYSADQSKALK